MRKLFEESAATHGPGEVPLKAACLSSCRTEHVAFSVEMARMDRQPAWSGPDDRPLQDGQCQLIPPASVLVETEASHIALDGVSARGSA